MKQWILLLVVWLSGSLAATVLAGSLEAPGKPADVSSAMFTLEDIHQRLKSGVIGSRSAFAGPTTGPGAVVGKSLNDIMSIAPAKNVAGAKPEEMACGKTFWGLLEGVWGYQVGIAGCPPQPTGIQITAVQNGVATLTWPAVVDVTSYTVYFATQTGLTQYNYASLTGGGRRNSVTSPVTVSGLTNGVINYLYVASVGPGGERLSDPVSTTPVSTKIEVKLAQNGQAILSWTPVAEAISYDVYVATKAGLTLENHASQPGGMVKKNVSTPFTLTGLTNGVTYYLYLSPVTAGGAGLSDPVTTTPVYVRFADNDNGTVTDIESGLILLKNANCFGEKIWTDALVAAASLGHGQCGLTDLSRPGQWRLPSIPNALQPECSYSACFLKDLTGESGVLIYARTSTAFTNTMSNSSTGVRYWLNAAYDGFLQGNSSKDAFAWAVALWPQDGWSVVMTDLKTKPHFIWPVREP